MNWLVTSQKSELIQINTLEQIEIGNKPPYDKPASATLEFALQKPGRLLLSTQFSLLELRNSVPYTTSTSWWTDYTTDIDCSKISILSILLPRLEDDNLAGFIEMDKLWDEQTLRPETQHQKWEFVAISLSTSSMEDYMHMYLTLMRNVDFPLVLSRNVRQLIVNAMLLEWNGGVARRLGVGKVFLNMWERSSPGMRWVVLE
jgi:hypothetical protein